MLTTDGRSLTVDRQKDNGAVIKVGGRTVLKINGLQSFALREALQASIDPYGKKEVYEGLMLVGFNDEIALQKGNRAVARVQMHQRLDLADMLAGTDRDSTGAFPCASPTPATTPSVKPATAGNPSQHRSNSQLGTFGLCGHRYKLERVDKVLQRPGVAALAGTALHKVAEAYEEARYRNLAGMRLNGEPYPVPGRAWAANSFVAQFRFAINKLEGELYGTEWAEPNSWWVAGKGKEGIDWWYANGVQFAMDFIGRRTDDFETLVLDGKPAIELAIDDVIGDISYKAVIDHVSIDNQGYVDVVDYKSGAQVPKDRGFQPVTYAHVLKRKYPNMKIRGGSYYDFRTGELISYPLGEWSWDQIKHRYKMLDKGIMAEAYLPVSGTHCYWCSVRRNCEYAL